MLEPKGGITLSLSIGGEISEKIFLRSEIKMRVPGRELFIFFVWIFRTTTSQIGQKG